MLELKWLHLASLIVLLGMSISYGIVVRVAASAEGSVSEALWKICDQFEKPIQISSILVLVSGPLLLWLKYGTAGLTVMFWIKMALVAALLVNVVIGLGAVKKLRGGAMDAMDAMKRFSTLEIVISFAVVMAAVFTFN